METWSPSPVPLSVTGAFFLAPEAELSGVFVDRMKLSTEFGLPLPSHIKIYVITPSGVYITEELSAETLAGGNHEFSPLFLAGNDVMTELRIADGGQ